MKKRTLQGILAIVFFISITILFNRQIIFGEQNEYPTIWYNNSVMDTGDIFDGARILQEMNATASRMKEGDFHAPPFDGSEESWTLLYPAGALLATTHLQPIVVFKLFYYFCYFLNGLAFFLLARKVKLDMSTSLLLGFLFMTTNYMISKIVMGHENIMQMFWVPLIFYALESIREHPSIPKQILLGFLLFFQLIASTQYTVFLSVMIVIYMLYHYKKIQSYLLSAGVFLLLGLPFFIEHIHIETQIRTIEEAAQSFWVLDTPMELFSINSELYIGFVVIILALIGIIIAYTQKKKRWISFATIGMLHSSLA